MDDLSSNSVILNIEEDDNIINNQIIVKDGKLSQSFEIEMNNIDKEVDKKYEEIIKQSNCPPIQCNEENNNCLPWECIVILLFFATLFILVGLRANNVF